MGDNYLICYNVSDNSLL